MSLTGALTLSSDVLVIRVSDLPALVREELGDDGAYALTRARGRSPSILVNEASAELVGEFREPSTVVDALIRFGRRLQRDPEPLLAELYPTLRRLVTAGYLVPADSDDAGPHRVAFATGERVAGCTVVRCVRVLEDTEMYQLATDGGELAALKVQRAGRTGLIEGALQREAEMLTLLNGTVSPRLLSQGETGGHRWVCMEWCEGVPVNIASTALRRSGSDDGLLRLARRVAEAYAALHGQGVVHGDVHPGNLLVAVTGDVRLIDFGTARVAVGAEGNAGPPRGGVQAYCDPEYAAAQLRGTRPPAASFASDQFSVGAVLYQAITGSSYVDFSLDRAEQLRQVVEDPPLPFTRRGRAPWPEVERALRRALAKGAADRFGSCEELAGALARINPIAAPASRPQSDALEGALSAVIAKASPGGTWFEAGVPAAPFCSVAYGAAGLAVALYRVGVLRSDPALVALADEWTVRATREAHREGAFTSEDLPLREDRTGLISPFHRLSGVHAVQALVSHALGNAAARQHALEEFVAESSRPCANLDLTLGRSGTVLAAAMLLEAICDAPYASTTSVVELGRRTSGDIWQALDAMPALREGTNLGMAHGWAGFLFATLRWCRAAADPLPTTFVDRLDQLAGLARVEGRRAHWVWGRSGTMPGWCNGSAGFVHLWALAHATLHDDRWAALAEQAAWDASTRPTGITQLCCGRAGQAYALLALYTHTGDDRWLRAARELGARAATGSDALIAGSLHKGDTGIAVLAADLACPEAAAMPFFGIQ